MMTGCSASAAGLIARSAFTILLTSSSFAQTTASAEPVTLTVGYSSSVFYDVSVTDARAATRVLADALMKEAGLEGRAEVVIIEDPSRLAAEVKDRDIDIISVLCSEYFKELTNAPVEPVLTAQRRSSNTDQYLLLTRRDRPGSSLSDLGGSTLLTAVDWEASVPMMWIDDLLRRDDLPDHAEFFGEIRKVKSTLKATLPVFFGSEDACLVSQSVYETVSEMNPQISRALRVVATSPGYGYGLVCFSNRLGPTTRELVMATLRRLHQSPQGQQLLTLFYVDRLVPFNKVHLESTAQLIRRHQAVVAD